MSSGTRRNEPAQRAATDGRSTRWESHREQRRAELVNAAVSAIDRHGREASIDDIAKVAGVSKPVLYRYFNDKADLHAAVGQWGAALVLERIAPLFASEAPMKARVYDAMEAYFEVIEEHPQVFLLLVQHRVKGDADPLADGKDSVAAAISRIMGESMHQLGIDAGGAEPWSQAVVGLGLSTGEWWIERQTMTRAAVSRYLADFVWGALVGISRNNGVPLPVE